MEAHICTHLTGPRVQAHLTEAHVCTYLMDPRAWAHLTDPKGVHARRTHARVHT